MLSFLSLFTIKKRSPQISHSAIINENELKVEEKELSRSVSTMILSFDSDWIVSNLCLILICVRVILLQSLLLLICIHSHFIKHIRSNYKYVVYYSVLLKGLQSHISVKFNKCMQLVYCSKWNLIWYLCDCITI